MIENASEYTTLYLQQKEFEQKIENEEQVTEEELKNFFNQMIEKDKIHTKYIKISKEQMFIDFKFYFLNISDDSKTLISAMKKYLDEESKGIFNYITLISYSKKSKKEPSIDNAKMYFRYFKYCIQYEFYLNDIYNCIFSANNKSDILEEISTKKSQIQKLNDQNKEIIEKVEDIVYANYNKNDNVKQNILKR